MWSMDQVIETSLSLSPSFIPFFFLKERQREIEKVG